MWRISHICKVTSIRKVRVEVEADYTRHRYLHNGDGKKIITQETFFYSCLFTVFSHPIYHSYCTIVLLCFCSPNHWIQWLHIINIDVIFKGIRRPSVSTCFYVTKVVYTGIKSCATSLFGLIYICRIVGTPLDVCSNCLSLWSVSG